MSRVAAYSTLYPFLVPELPGCPQNIILQALQKAGRVFAIRTQAWREDVFPVALTNYQRDYAIPSVSSSARAHRVLCLSINGIEQPKCIYELLEEGTIRFKSEHVPHDLDDSLLICATAGTVVIATWQAITSGSVTITIDSGTYALTALNFASCADMDAIALVIQTALRAEIEGNTGFVQWDAVNSKFGVWTETGTVSYLTAGTAGTDISGAGYMNGLTGAGVLSPRMDLRLVFRPDVTTEVLPSWFLDRYAEAITALAMADLMNMPKKPWTNGLRSAEYRGEYNRMLNGAIADDMSEYRSTSYEVRA